MTDGGDAPTLRQWVGRAVRELREQHGQRQDDVARSARELGLTWTATKIAALERGDKALPAEELLLLPLVLTWAGCGRPSLADLLPDGPGSVSLSEGTTIPATVLAQVTRGEDVDVTDVDSPRMRERLSRIEQWADSGGPQRMTAMVRVALAISNATSRQLVDAERAAGDAERIAARRLGVPVGAVVAASLGTWQRGLTDERDARAVERAGPGATPRTIQAARGHVTRELYHELGPAIERYRRATETTHADPPQNTNTES